jgi:NTP pyrophosphatase (non-canonical NTP hydrolase)
MSKILEQILTKASAQAQAGFEKFALNMLDIADEYKKATSKFGVFHNTHEGYAILKEEVDELWDAIKTNAPQAEIRKEAIQVAAMAIRFLCDLTEKGEQNHE